MEEQLELITKCIEWNEDSIKKTVDPEMLVKVATRLVTSLFYLEIIRADYHKKHQEMIFNLVSSGHSVARAENEANVKIPELYLLRRVMDAAYRTLDFMKSKIYNLRKEMSSN